MRVELRVDLGSEKEQETKAIFSQLQEHKDDIEKAFGGDLIWSQKPGTRAGYIRYTIDGIGFNNDKDRWTEAFSKAVDAMIRLEKAIKPILSNLR